MKHSDVYGSAFHTQMAWLISKMFNNYTVEQNCKTFCFTVQILFSFFHIIVKQKFQISKHVNQWLQIHT